jgi:hypothetical protein
LQEAEVRFLQIIAVAWLMLVGAVAMGHAEKRVALVIGNNRYANLADHEQLRKAVNDAQAVGGSLRQVGFEVITGENLVRQAFIDKLDETARRLSVGDTVFFFFAGHGVAVDGVNYVLPVDVPDVQQGQVTRLTGAAVREEDITAALMRTGARLAVVVLDACRDNPFGAGTRGVGGERGLAPHEPPKGVFTLYSASRGQAALDRVSDDDRNPNSVFTRVLAPELTRPGFDLAALAIHVREEVAQIAQAAGHPQRPSYYDETVGGQVYLAGLPAAHSGSGGGASPPPAAQTLNPNFYYRLSTEFRGADMSLDVFNGGPKNNMTHLEKSQDVAGQYWKFLPSANDSYRLTTMFRGPAMCLDIFNGDNDNQLYLARCANVSGQFWSVRAEGAWVRLTSKFRGENMCLDIFNGGPNDNQPHLTHCADVSGQMWLLSQTNRR